MATTFTRKTKTENRSTGAISVSETTIAGNAMKVRGNPSEYRESGLVESEAPTLLFVPTTYGDRISEGDTVTWRNILYTVKKCFHLEPDGVVISTRVMIAR
jgi:hypothetical protein